MLNAHFDDYAQTKYKQQFHLPSDVNDMTNIIFYGPTGTGKYTQMLKSIKQFSHSKLKYEKRLNVTFNKDIYLFKISDIHYEIDMALLGCNSKLLWHEVYMQIVDVVSSKQDKYGIIVCKNFNEIHSELLDNFYSYMQYNPFLYINLKFIILTSQISFIPDNILNACVIVSSNNTIINAQVCLSHKIICDKVIKMICQADDMDFVKLRDVLYDILIYNLDIHESLYYIVYELNERGRIKSMSDVIKEVYCFFQFYNNNYRPIYHLEKLVLNLHVWSSYDMVDGTVYTPLHILNADP
jgi:hypothetical protein